MRVLKMLRPSGSHCVKKRAIALVVKECVDFQNISWLNNAFFLDAFFQFLHDDSFQIAQRSACSACICIAYPQL